MSEYVGQAIVYSRLNGVTAYAAVRRNGPAAANSFVAGYAGGDLRRESAKLL